jgi:hypothetical protein
VATKPVATIGRSSISGLFEDLALARGDGRHPRILRNLGRADLLILDDWGLEPLDAAALLISWKSSKSAMDAAPQ